MKYFFEGAISCKAILEGKKRKSHTLYVDRNKRTKDFSYIIHLAKKENVEVQFLDRNEIDEMATGKSHGGMLLACEERSFPALGEKIHGYIAYLDGLEDPYNLGSICRTLYASGAQALILPKRDWKEAEPVILRASAGAYEKLDIYFIDKEEELIDYIQTNHIPLYCAHRKEAKGLYAVHFPQDFCLAIGGAMRGLSSLITKNSTQNVVIEYGREYRNALDSASAVAVFSFEILRQKKEG